MAPAARSAATANASGAASSGNRCVMIASAASGRVARIVAATSKSRLGPTRPYIDAGISSISCMQIAWPGIATLSTWTMTLFIQRTEHRDTQAIHAKLDELLRTDPRAETDVARMDEREPEDIEKYREDSNRK